MTKSEFVDKVADTSGLSKKDAGSAVEAVLDTIEGALKSGEDVTFTGLRQVPCRQPRRARGSQPAHGRVDADRGEQGAALHRRLEPQEGHQVSARAGDALTDAGEASPAAPFGDRLAVAVARRESQVVLGHRSGSGAAVAGRGADAARAGFAARPALAAAEAAAGVGRARRRRRAGLELAAAVLAHCRALIEAAAPACVAAKPQLACFERLGFAGWLALEAVVAHAHDHGLLVIADAKRGDFPGTARAYAQAVFGGVAGAATGRARRSAPTP